MNEVSKLKIELIEAAQPEREKSIQRFFKTQPGDYAERDVFIGVPMAVQRDITKRYIALSLEALTELIQSEIHEHRSAALLLLIKKFERAVQKPKKEAVVKCYLENLSWVNNWNLVDMSAHKILGRFAFKDRNYIKVIEELSEDDSMWKNRVAMVSTLYFIKQGETLLTCQLAKKLIYHEHPLIHKAVGWLLREVGKKDIHALKGFLDQNKDLMSRTTLRYAVEKFPKEEKREYLS